MSIHLPTQIAGIEFSNVLMNAAYIDSKSLEDAVALTRSASGGVVVGSISVKPRGSNTEGGYWLHKENFYTLNSFGMPNGGLSYFKENLPVIVKVAHAQNKPLVANLIGFTKEEFVQLIELAEVSGADMAELNFGCPNVWDKGKQKRIISYHASLVTETLNFIRQHKPTIKLSVKISPLPPDILYEVSMAIAESGIVQVVTAVNSYPNAAITTGTRKAGDSDQFLAGLAGRALKPISLGVVTQLRQLLPENIDIIGCGGISSANDVRDYLTAGAKAVQIASALVNDGPSLFEKILFQSDKM